MNWKWLMLSFLWILPSLAFANSGEFSDCAGEIKEIGRLTWTCIDKTAGASDNPFDKAVQRCNGSAVKQIGRLTWTCDRSLIKITETPDNPFYHAVMRCGGTRYVRQVGVTFQCISDTEEKIPATAIPNAAPAPPNEVTTGA